MKKSLITALLSLAALGHASVSEVDFEDRAPSEDLHLWLSPMLGSAGPGPAIGIGADASHLNYMVSVRAIAATGACFFDCVNEYMSQKQFLLGWKQEGSMGYVALLSGLSTENLRGSETNGGLMLSLPLGNIRR